MSPVPPPSTTAPYDYLESVLNVARTRLNDAIQSIGGDILTDTQPFTGTMTNSAWRKLQAFLCNMGYSRYKRKFWAYAFPIVDSTDPSTETQWTWTQWVNASGAVYAPPVIAPLPQDLIAPLVIKERQAGSNAPFQHRIPSAPDGLAEVMKRPWNPQFEWKDDTIYMQGSTFSMDFEVEYAAYDADFEVDDDDVLVNPSTTQVTIMRSQSSFANFLCAEMALGRDDMDGASFVADAEKDAKLMMNNSDVKLKQRHPVQRGAYSGRGGRRGYLYGTSGY